MTKIFEQGIERFEDDTKDQSTEMYIKLWKAKHDWEFKRAQDYVANIRLGQQKASLLAIEQIRSRI